MTAGGAGELVSFSVVRYSAPAALLGAAHMATQRPLLQRTPGLSFYRLLGMGAGIGFSATPDLRSWALLCAWESPADWERFAADSRVFQQYRERGDELYSLLLQPLSSHGTWGGVRPFASAAAPPLDPAETVVVLTRASIRPSRALRFWSRVRPVDRTLRGHPDLLLSFGVGEAPYLRQATLSVWRSTEAMRSWAYSTQAHEEVVRRTREEGWYSEELFARFRLLDHRGTFRGVDPLGGGI